MNELIDLLLNSHIILPSVAGVGIVGMSAYLLTKKKKKKPTKNVNEGTEYYTQDSIDYDQTLDNTVPSTEIKRLLKPDLSTDFQDTMEEEPHERMEFEKPSVHKPIKAHPLNDDVVVQYNPEKDIFSDGKKFDFESDEENFFNSKEFLEDNQDKNTQENFHHETLQLQPEEKHVEPIQETASEPAQFSFEEESEENNEVKKADNRLPYEERLQLLKDSGHEELTKFVPVEFPALEVAQNLVHEILEKQTSLDKPQEYEPSMSQEVSNHKSQQEQNPHLSLSLVEDEIISEVPINEKETVLQDSPLENPVLEVIDLPALKTESQISDNSFEPLPVAPSPAFEPSHFEELEKVDYHDYILAALNFDKLDNKIEALANLKQAAPLISNKKVYFYFKMAIQSYENATTTHKLPEIIDHFYYMEKQKLKQDEKAKFEAKNEPKVEEKAPVQEIKSAVVTEPEIKEESVKPQELTQTHLEPEILNLQGFKNETQSHPDVETEESVKEDTLKQENLGSNHNESSQTVMEGKDFATSLENVDENHSQKSASDILEITEEVVEEIAEQEQLAEIYPVATPAIFSQDIRIENTDNLFKKEEPVSLADSVMSQFGETSNSDTQLNLDKLPVLTEVVEPTELNFEIPLVYDDEKSTQVEEVPMTQEILESEKIQEQNYQHPLVIESNSESLEQLNSMLIEVPKEVLEEKSSPEILKSETSHDESIQKFSQEHEEDDSSKLFSAFQSFISPSPVTESTDNSLLATSKTKYRVWVNWMTTTNNQMDMRNDILEIDNPWGSAKAVEEVHEQLGYRANKNADGKPQFAVISVIEMKE